MIGFRVFGFKGFGLLGLLGLDTDVSISQGIWLCGSDCWG